MADVGVIRARLELNAQDWSSKQAQIKSDMAGLSKSALNTKKSLTGIQQGAGIMAAGIAAALGAATMAGANFEAQMDAVGSISGATGEQMQRLSDLAMEAGKTTAYSSLEAAQGIEELLKAGLSVEDVLGGGLKGALDLASAGGIQLAEAAKVASTALNSFKEDGMSVSDAANLLSGAANASATDVKELSYGLSQVSAVASGAGMNFKDVTTALAVFASAGLAGSDAGTSLKTLLMTLTPSTKSASDQMKKLGIITKDGSNQFYDAQGNLKSLAEITDVLRDSLDELNPEQRSAALKEMFGADGIRSATILYKEGAKGIEEMANAMSKVTAAEVAKEKLDNLKGAAAELTSQLETFGIQVSAEFIPVFRAIVDAGIDISKSLNDVNMSALATGIKMAAAGSGVALLLSTIGKLSIALRGLMVSLGPGGWAILGISALSAVFVGLNDTMSRNTEVSLDNYNAMKQNNDALQTSITTFETLSAKNRLSSDEMQRFLDITSELNQTAYPAAITRLKDEQAKLSEKSGLSAQEMQNLVKANDDLVKKVPDSNKVLTDQGNILLKNADAAKKLSDEQLNGMRNELNEQKIKAEAKLNDLMSDREAALNRMNRAIERQKELIETRKTQEVFLAEQEAILADMKANKNLYAQKEIDLQQTIVLNAQDDVQLAKERIAKEQGKIEKQRESLAESDKEIQKLDTINQKLVNIELQQVGINNKKGNGIRLVDNEIAKLIEQKRKLDESTSAKDKNNSEYREAIATIDREIGKLNAAKDAVNRITGAQSGVNSRVADGIALAQRLNDVLSKSINKTVNITEIKRLITQNERAARSIGVDTSRHQGGPLPKFHSGGSPALSLPPSHHEIDVRLLRNEMVLTEAQQSSLFRMLDVPNGGSENTGLSAEDITAIINAASNAKQPVEIPLFIDSYEIARVTWPAVDQFQATQASNDFRVKGNKN